MIARRAALLLGSAGLHGAALALLALLATRAGLPPVLTLDLSAWEAAAPALGVAARAGETAAAPDPARLRFPGSAGSFPAIVPRQPAPVTPAGETEAERLPSRALAGSQAPGALQERAAPARRTERSAEVGAEAPVAASAAAPAAPRAEGPAVRSGAEPAPPGQHAGALATGPGATQGAATVKAEAGGADPGTGAWRGAAGERPSGHDGASGLGLHGGSRVALATPGDGGGVPPEYGPYLARFRQRIQDALIYPMAARRRGLAGRVELDVLIDPAGRVQRVELTASSSHALLDEAAMETVREIEPLPLPDALPRRPLRVKLPLVFELR